MSKPLMPNHICGFNSKVSCEPFPFIQGLLVQRDRVQTILTWPLEQHSPYQVVLHKEIRTSECKPKIIIYVEFVNGEKISIGIRTL